MGVKPGYDFCGWATRFNVECDDGRTILPSAFADCDGKQVPIVYGHNHTELDKVLGHAILENRADGVYAYGYFNDTDNGKLAKKCAEHGDIKSLSIYANKLKQRGGDVVHGIIRELSLVLAGANPEAGIEAVLAHGEDLDEAMVIISEDPEFELSHASEEEKEMDDDKKKPEEKKEETKEETKEDGKEESLGDVVSTMSEKQQKAMWTIVKMAKEGRFDDDSDEDKENGGKEEMKHNAFDVVGNEDEAVLSHDALTAILEDGKKQGTLKESFLAHSAEYGIDHIDYIAPEFQNVNGEVPGFIKRQPSEWVNIVMNGVHHTPFAKVKMLWADITAEEARAKGYTKGDYKEEEVFDLLKREVSPTTIYKKQKMDRDDIVDITSFDVVAWIKSEMRMMLDEEIARAILFGDGRSNASKDKIKEDKVIPIAKDAALYTIEKEVTVPAGSTQAMELVDACVEAQDNYEGSGNLTLFCARSTLTAMRLLKDANGIRLYKDANEVAMACGVSRIVPVPAAIIPTGTIGVMVDLSDYNVGADKGGSINMFEDFDIDYNQEKYLIETRISGALTKPYSAIVLKAAAQG